MSTQLWRQISHKACLTSVILKAGLAVREMSENEAALAINEKANVFANIRGTI